MAISPTAPPTFLDEIRQLRADTATLQGRASTLATEYTTIQSTAYDSYNQSHVLYDSAYDASTDTGDINSSADGLAMNAQLPVVTADQTALTAANTQSLTDVGFCQTQIGQLAQRLTALVAAAPAGPVAASLQSALGQLTQGVTEQTGVNFDATADLATTAGLIQSITVEAGEIAGDGAPGSDVSSVGKQAISDIDSAQMTFQQIATNAETQGQFQLLASEYCTATVEWLDQAIGLLAPSNSGTNTIIPRAATISPI